MNDRNYKGNFQLMAEAYFNQPVFDQKVSVSFNPLKFRRLYRMSLLEHCWQLDYEMEMCRLQLENCWQKACLGSVPTLILKA